MNTLDRQWTLRLLVLLGAAATLSVFPIKVDAQTADPLGFGASSLSGGSSTPIGTGFNPNAPAPGAGALGTGSGTAAPAGSNSPLLNQVLQGDPLKTLSTGGFDLNNLGSLGSLVNLGNLSFLGDIQNLFKNLPTLDGLFKGSQGAMGIPDTQKIGEVLQQVPAASGASAESIVLSSRLEAQDPNKPSYVLQQDRLAQAQRDSTIGLANSSAITSAAQSQLKARVEMTQQLTQDTMALGEKAKVTDVSQKILTGQSEQIAKVAQVQQQQLLEAFQARNDRAVSNLMAAQQSEQLSIMNTSERRKGIAAGSSAMQQVGLMSLPGGYYLGSDKAGSSTSPATPAP